MGHYKTLSKVGLAFVLVMSPMALAAHGMASLPEEHNLAKEKISHIDDQISSMMNLKNYYMAKAVRYRNRANRIKYQNSSESEDESSQLMKQAEECDDIVKKINIDLAKLEGERRKLEKKLS